MQKYGSLFSTKLGSQLVIVLSDYKLIRDVFRKEEFTGRPITEFSSILGGYGEFKYAVIIEYQCFTVFIADKTMILKMLIT